MTQPTKNQCYTYLWRDSMLWKKKKPRGPDLRSKTKTSQPDLYYVAPGVAAPVPPLMGRKWLRAVARHLDLVNRQGHRSGDWVTPTGNNYKPLRVRDGEVVPNSHH